MKPTPTETYLDWLFADAGLVELRHNIGVRWDSYWYDNAADLLARARELSGDGALYTTLNRPKLRVIKNGPGEPAVNDDFMGIVRLPFDLDPERPTGVCSTNAELAEASRRRDDMVRQLHTLGWPLPLIGCSGNGAHIQYRVNLRETTEARQVINALYGWLSGLYGDDVVKFDTAVKNSARIFRLYGSINRKGENTPERPHRKTWCRIPPRWQQVPPWKLERVANASQRSSNPHHPIAPRNNVAMGRGDYSTLDVIAWFSAHGLYMRHIKENMHEVTCPWEHEHSCSNPGDTVIFEGSGDWPGFFCNHAHCEGRRIGEVMEYFGDADTFCRQDFGGAA